MYNIVWTEDKKEKAIAELTKYFEKHGIGECIQQSDSAIIEAPDVLSHIADRILKEGEGINYRETEE